MVAQYRADDIMVAQDPGGPGALGQQVEGSLYDVAEVLRPKTSNEEEKVEYQVQLAFAVSIIREHLLQRALRDLAHHHAPGLLVDDAAQFLQGVVRLRLVYSVVVHLV